METFTLSDGHTIPALGFGTYQLTGKGCTQIVEAALEIGYRHIDTADYYENHRAIAPALKPYPREALYLVSKIWPGDHTRKRVPIVCNRSLKELETDYLDLFLIHWPDRSVPFAETLEAMAALQEAGKIRSIGVSNFTIRHLTAALQAGVPIVVNQIECHPYFYQRELVDFCQERGIRITAWAPLLRGEVISEPLFIEIGERYGKTPAQVTLRWLTQKGHIAIPKTSHRKRALENFSIFDFKLSGDEIKKIEGLNTGVRQFNPSFADFD
ncbi:MAG: aldo/keto reductase [Parachlamydiales bacterium]